jgi:hypothetical protein
VKIFVSNHNVPNLQPNHFFIGTRQNINDTYTTVKFQGTTILNIGESRATFTDNGKFLWIGTPKTIDSIVTILPFVLFDITSVS